MLQDSDLMDRHRQSLGEAHAACQRLGRNADPTFLAPRGKDYGALKRALDELEGTCRQFAHARSDARWLKLGILYAKTKRGAQQKFVGQRWTWFGDLTALFDLGKLRLTELADAKTGVAGAILPKRPSDWIIMPDPKPMYAPVPKVLN